MINSDIPGLLGMAKTIAMVGLSDKPWRPSYRVAKAALRAGYTIHPVNPTIKRWHDLPVYPDLASVPGPIDIVDIFRRADEAGAVVDEAIRVGAKAVWLQLGVIDHAAAERALAAGLRVVMDRCLAVELEM
jgi:uncharacterized protein